jgi:4-hydroxythreonine-4-phosphate dehydrogenase
MIRMKRIGITLGDPAGIGPEVIDAALSAIGEAGDVVFQVIGSRDATPGVPTSSSAGQALCALHEAADGMRNGRFDAVVTGPVSKRGLQDVGFPFPGQTEFFADALGIEDFGMMLAGERLTVGLATIHEPLAAVPGLLTVERIMRISCLTAEFLGRRGIGRPRIAVAGLNPHAGEDGAFGDEETRVILPAIERLNSLDLADFTGPAVPDAIFRDAAQGRYHAVIAMYHDQGLIPLKLLDFENAVNVTLGLPVPRVSPDHGTAFAIAGRGIANPSSMIAAIRLACEIA